VLIVEDEPLIAMMIEDALTEAGAAIAGLAATVAEALAAIGAGSRDLAILNLSLAGEDAGRVADALAERGVPFAFVSGYLTHPAMTAHAAAPALRKPFDPDDLMRILARLVGQARCRPPEADRGPA
jgi:DNA-binding NtrC family response regulator